MKYDSDTLIAMIATTQDGGLRDADSRFTRFILDTIEENDSERDGVDVERVASDFHYMIDQLKKALAHVQPIADAIQAQQDAEYERQQEEKTQRQAEGARTMIKACHAQLSEIEPDSDEANELRGRIDGQMAILNSINARK